MNEKAKERTGKGPRYCRRQTDMWHCPVLHLPNRFIHIMHVQLVQQTWNVPNSNSIPIISV